LVQVQHLKEEMQLTSSTPNKMAKKKLVEMQQEADKVM